MKAKTRENKKDIRVKKYPISGRSVFKIKDIIDKKTDGRKKD